LAEAKRIRDADVARQDAASETVITAPPMFPAVMRMQSDTIMLSNLNVKEETKLEYIDDMEEPSKSLLLPTTAMYHFNEFHRPPRDPSGQAIDVDHFAQFATVSSTTTPASHTTTTATGIPIEGAARIIAPGDPIPTKTIEFVNSVKVFCKVVQCPLDGRSGT
jgi:hypothetical protein